MGCNIHTSVRTLKSNSGGVISPTLLGVADLEKPTSDNTVVEIKAYLDTVGISYKSNATKSELLELVGE